MPALTEAAPPAKPAPKPKPKPPTDRKEPPAIFFDARDSGYWLKIRSRFVKLGSRDIKLHLLKAGLSEDEKREGLRETDWHLWNAQMNSLIDYAGPLGGHRTGLFENGSGRKFLVTDESRFDWGSVPNKIPKSEPKWFRKFLQELLPDEQHVHFAYWLRTAVVSMTRGEFRPGQAVVLAGPPGCGKSLLQSIVTEVLGGRAASPFRYMMGLTQFNYDLAGSEHWQIEDPSSSTDLRTRRHFGAMLKEATVNRDFGIHQKGKDGLLLPVFRRVTISVNDEPENLSVIPPLDASLMDKIFLFKCGKANVPPDRVALWKEIRASIPHIRSWVYHLPDPPEPLRDARFGIKAWQHPDLLKDLSDLSPEARLLELIDHIVFARRKPEDAGIPWMGKAVELENQLRASTFSQEVGNLLRFNSACGVYLSRLNKLVPSRFTKRLRDGVASWVINPPSQKEETK